MIFAFHPTEKAAHVGKIFDVCLDAGECAEHFYQALAETLATLSGEDVHRRPLERGWILKVKSSRYAVAATETSVGMILLIVAKCPGGSAEIPVAVSELMRHKAKLEMLTIEFDDGNLTATERSGVPTWIPQPIIQSELSR